MAAIALAKASKSHIAIMSLCANGNGEDAAIISRSLFELAVVMKYIFNDKTDDLLTRFIEYAPVKASQSIKHAEKHESLLEELKRREENPRPGQSIVAEIHAAADEILGRQDYNAFGWSDKKLWEMARTIGRQHFYDTMYPMLSGLTHSDSLSFSNYYKESEDGFFVDAGESDNWVSESLIIAFDYMHLILSIVHDELDLDYEAKLNQLVNEFNQAVDKMNDSEE